MKRVGQVDLQLATAGHASNPTSILQHITWGPLHQPTFSYCISSTGHKAAFQDNFRRGLIYYWCTETLKRLPEKKSHSDQGTSTWFSCAAIYTGEVPISCGVGGETSKKTLPVDMGNPGVGGMLGPLLPLEVVGLNAERSGFSKSRKAIGGQQKHLQNSHHTLESKKLILWFWKHCHCWSTMCSWLFFVHECTLMRM